MSKRFTRTIEDFACGHCGAAVSGDGYTNHCPVCLWSRHLDVHPGDRAADCGGMMEPVGVARRRGEWVLTHRCVVCGCTRRQSASRADNFERMLELSASGGLE